MKVLVVGSLAYDRILDFPGYFRDNILPQKIHLINISFHVDRLTENFGGTAGNIAYNLTLLGEKPSVFAAVGKDFGRYRTWLLKHRIDITGLRKVKNEYTACAHIITDQADNQITGFYPGAMRWPSRLKIPVKPKETLAIVAPGNIEDMVTYPKIFFKRKIPFIFDPSMQIPRLTCSQLLSGLKGCAALIGNDYEQSMFLKKTGNDKKKLLKRVPVVITTRGARGTLIETTDRRYLIPPARPDNELDPTGAGDAFRAGLIAGISRGYSLERAARLGSVVAVYTVEKYGTQTHQFSWASIKKRYYLNYHEKL
jgi:adenosine kinase